MGNVAMLVVLPRSLRKQLADIRHLQQTLQWTSRSKSSVWFPFNVQSCIWWCTLVWGRPDLWLRKGKSKHVICFLDTDRSLGCRVASPQSSLSWVLLHCLSGTSSLTCAGAWDLGTHPFSIPCLNRMPSRPGTYVFLSNSRSQMVVSVYILHSISSVFLASCFPLPTAV